MASAPVIAARVSPEVYAEFIDFCAGYHLSMAEALRPAINNLIAGDLNHHFENAPPKRKGHKACRFELRLSPSERDLVKQLAHADGVSIQNWFIYRLLDTKIDGRFVGSRDAKNLAGELEKVLRTIIGMAHNLNQVARALNSSRRTGEQVPKERLLILSVIEKDLMAFVHRAHGVLDALENPRGLAPTPKKNAVPVTPELCEVIRKSMDAMIQAKLGEGA